jgi:hypothetical protein
MVVFTEGFDPGPMDRGSDPEACEIGGLGTLSLGPVGTGRPSGWRVLWLPRRGDDFDRSVTYSGRGKGASPCTRCLVRRSPECRARRTVTWLILPVVICLSQRLSHACLSINNSIL